MMHFYYAFSRVRGRICKTVKFLNLLLSRGKKTNLLEIFLQLRLDVPWCNSLGQSPERCKKIFLIYNFELWTSVYLGLHLSIDISLGKSCRERFVYAETVCMNGNSFLDGEQQYLNSSHMTANIFWAKVTTVSIISRHYGRRNKSINKDRKACVLCKIWV